jgi:putative membrane protein
MWEVDPATLIVISALAVFYLGGALLLQRRPAAVQILAYAAGMLVIVGAVIGPIDQLTKDRSFAIYIFQQMLLVFVVPPLLLAGIPDWMLRPVMLNRLVKPIARRLTRPIVAFLLFSAVFTLIHYPALCDRVCHVHPFYGDIHTLLLFTGTLLWWPLLSPLPEYPRMSYPMQILYLFLLMIPMTAVAAPITLANSVLYMFYMGGTHPFGLSPMTDQVIGGIIMWVGQGTYIMFAFTAIFIRWARYEDQEMPPINRQPIPQFRVLHPQNRPSL